MKNIIVWVFFAVLLAVSNAGATVITSLPGGTVVAMPAANYVGGGPVVFGPGITWSSTNTSNGCFSSTQCGSVFGFTPSPTGYYDFGSNGKWNHAGTLFPMAGLNDSTDLWGSTDTMTFTFKYAVSSVGGFLNYVPGSFNPTTIAVYDSSCDPTVSPFCTPIESYDLTFPTSTDNSGAFFGFMEATNSIKYFTLTDNYIGITGLTYIGTPESGSLLLLGSGLLAAVGYSRRRMGL